MLHHVLHRPACGAFVVLLAGLAAPASAVPANPCHVTADPTTGQYVISNDPGGFDVTAFVVRNTVPEVFGFKAGLELGATAPGWDTQLVTESNWDQPMGNIAGQPTWEQVTGIDPDHIFGNASTPPGPCFGYFLAFNNNGGTLTLPADPCRPGSSLAGFSVNAAALSTPGQNFLAFGPDSVEGFSANITDNTFSGINTEESVTTAAPEPATIALGGIGALVLGLYAWRRRGIPV